MKLRTTISALASAAALLTQAAGAAEPARNKQALIERGRYLVIAGDCNGCHTPGYPETGGHIPQEKWLIGSNVGFQGPWGTSYPANLRLAAQAMTESQWVARAKQRMRPPMPWYSLRDMKDADVAAIYYFVRSLGPAGVAAPPPAAPGERVLTPYFDFVPKNLPQPAKR
jgi:mono/diheme cytochrome c family protein